MHSDIQPTFKWDESQYRLLYQYMCQKVLVARSISSDLSVDSELSPDAKFSSDIICRHLSAVEADKA